MEYGDNYIDDQQLPFTYEEFCKRYNDAGLKEYIKSVLVINKLSAQGQKKFLLSQLPYFKKIDLDTEQKKLYSGDVMTDNNFEYDISPNGAGQSDWLHIGEESGKGMLDFFMYLQGFSSRIETFFFIDSHLEIVRSSFSDLHKRLFPNLLEMKYPLRYVSRLNKDKDWITSLQKSKNLVEDLVEEKHLKHIYFRISQLEVGRCVLTLKREREVVFVSRSLFYDVDAKEMCLSLFEDKTLPICNYMAIKNYKDHDVVIFERYDWFEIACNRLADDFSPPIFTWLNPDKKFSDQDWSCFTERNVTFVFQKNSVESVNYALRFYKLCAGKNIKLTLVTYSYGGEEISSKWWGKGEILKIEDLRDFLHTHALENNEDNAKFCNSSDIKKPSDLEADTKLYLVETLFRPGDIVLLVAKQKVGKSLFSLDLSMMLSCGGAMGDHLKAPQAQQVLYVDAEMPSGEVKKRIDLLKINYEQSDLLDQNLGFFFPRENRKRLNLLLEDDQSLIERYLKGCKLLVLDNLGKMLPVRGEVNEKQWGDFFLWLEKISSKGITVLLVHHENKVGGHRGTGKITDDVDLVLSLKKVEGKEDDSNAIELTIEDSRFLHGKDCKPFVLEYSEDKRSVYSGEVKKAKVGQVTKEELSIVEDYLVRNNFPSSELKDRQKIILAPLCSGKSLCVRSRDFHKEFKVGPRTVQNLLADLCERRILVSEGPQKTIKYKLAKPVSS